MLDWLKGLFRSPKAFFKIAVDSLDLAVPFLAVEIGKIRSKVQAMSEVELAQFVVDKVQDFLRKRFGLDA